MGVMPDRACGTSGCPMVSLLESKDKEIALLRAAGAKAWENTVRLSGMISEPEPQHNVVRCGEGRVHTGARTGRVSPIHQDEFAYNA